MNHKFYSILKRVEKWGNKKGIFFVCLIFQKYDTVPYQIIILKLFIFKIEKKDVVIKTLLTNKK